MWSKSSKYQKLQLYGATGVLGPRFIVLPQDVESIMKPIKLIFNNSVKKCDLNP